MRKDHHSDIVDGPWFRNPGKAVKVGIVYPVYPFIPLCDGFLEKNTSLYINKSRIASINSWGTDSGSSNWLPLVTPCGSVKATQRTKGR